MMSHQAVFFVSKDPMHGEEFQELCRRASVEPRVVLSVEQLPAASGQPVVYDLAQMFPDERDVTIEKLARGETSGRVGACVKYIDEPIVAAMRSKGVVVSDALDERLLEVLAPIRAEKKAA